MSFIVISFVIVNEPPAIILEVAPPIVIEFPPDTPVNISLFSLASASMLKFISRSPSIFTLQCSTVPLNVCGADLINQVVPSPYVSVVYDVASVGKLKSDTSPVPATEY